MLKLSHVDSRTKNNISRFHPSSSIFLVLYVNFFLTLTPSHCNSYSYMSNEKGWIVRVYLYCFYAGGDRPDQGKRKLIWYIVDCNYCSVFVNRSTQQVYSWFGQWTWALRPYEWGSCQDSKQMERCRLAIRAWPGGTGGNCSHQPGRYQPLLHECLHAMEEPKLDNMSLYMVNSSAGSAGPSSWRVETSWQDQK